MEPEVVEEVGMYLVLRMEEAAAAAARLPGRSTR